MKAPLDWEREGQNWPHCEASQLVQAGGVKWHLQRMGSGPELLLLHGTGASCHSWQAIMPHLAEHFTLTVPDLPGHGFSQPMRGEVNLRNVTAALEVLLAEIDARPAIIAGHSAGAAIALQYARQHAADLPIVGFAPAIMPFPGLAAKLFPAMAKMLFINPLVPRIFAATTSIPGETQRFLRRATGSETGEIELACYQRLLGNHRHCEGALAMMANWDLDSFSAGLKDIPNPVLLVHGRKDKAVPTGSVESAAARLPHVRLDLLDNLGHLAHEEAPELATDLLLDFARERDVLSATAPAP